jgi:hypothetical protein
MRKRILTIFLVLTLIVGLSILFSSIYGAGSISETAVKKHYEEMIKKTSLDWTADASGDVSGTTTNDLINGEIMRIVTKPDTGATTPSDNYDIVIYDDDSVDVLMGLGANEPNSSNGHFVPLLGDGTTTWGRVPVHSRLELQVSNAGNANGGTVIIYWK